MKSPFLTWCAAQGITTPVKLCGEQSSYRYTTYAPNIESNDLYKNYNNLFPNNNDTKGGENNEMTLPMLLETNNDTTSSLSSSSSNTKVPVLRIPLSSCITGETPQKLSQKLAMERDLGNESKFAPYIHVLPKLLNSNGETDDDTTAGMGTEATLNSLPRFWSTSQIDFISNYDGGMLELKLRQEELNRQNLLDDLNKDETLDEWAYACVQSRANYVEGYGYAMTPILDMMNHDGTTKTSAELVPSIVSNDDDEEEEEEKKKDTTTTNNDKKKNKGGKGVGFGKTLSSSKATSPKQNQDLLLSIQPNPNNPCRTDVNDEVFISYGELTNVETLANYGFVSSKPNECNNESMILRMMQRPNEPLKVTIFDVDGSIDFASLNVLKKVLMEECGEDEEGMYSFVASYVDEAVYDAKTGIERIQERRDNGNEDEVYCDLVERYLEGRIVTMEKGLAFLKAKYPLLEY